MNIAPPPAGALFTPESCEGISLQDTLQRLRGPDAADACIELAMLTCEALSYNPTSASIFQPHSSTPLAPPLALRSWP